MAGESGWVVWDTIEDFNDNHDLAKSDHNPSIPFVSKNFRTGGDNTVNTITDIAYTFVHETDSRVTAFVYSGWPDGHREGYIYFSQDEVYNDGFTSVGDDNI